MSVLAPAQLSYVNVSFEFHLRGIFPYGFILSSLSFASLGLEMRHGGALVSPLRYGRGFCAGRGVIGLGDNTLIAAGARGSACHAPRRIVTSAEFGLNRSYFRCSRTRPPALASECVRPIARTLARPRT